MKTLEKRIMRKNYFSTSTGKFAGLTALVFSILGKFLGYIRTLITAALFGAGAVVDVFHVTTGVADLLVGTTRLSVETALLPELSRLRRDQKQAAEFSLMAVSLWICLGLSTLYAFLFLIFPKEVMNLFAFGFRDARLELGIKMLALLVPFLFVSALYGLLTTWALHTGKLTLPSLVESLYNPIAIPLLLILAPFYGALALPLSLSLGWTARLAIMLYAMKGIPWTWTEIPWSSLGRVGKNALYCVGMIGAGTLYQITDRFFASLLQVGTVAALGYAAFIYVLPLTLMENPLQIFLARSSRTAVESPEQGPYAVERMVRVGFYYFLPLGLGVAAMARPLISLAFGYGAFTETATALAGQCLSAYAVALAFALGGAVLWRYAQSRGKLKEVMLVGYATVLLNVVFDWVFAKLWGAPGIALATSLVTVIGLFVNVRVLLPTGAGGRLAGLSLRLLPWSLAWGLPLYWLAGKSTFWALAAGGTALLANWLLLERLPMFSDVPPEWMPRILVKEMLAGLRKAA
ncbi:MAG: murein biosynthesis integral membrane protein MurJ [Synergistales bacterium]